MTASPLLTQTQRTIANAVIGGFWFPFLDLINRILDIFKKPFS